jgi:cytidine deaminase
VRAQLPRATVRRLVTKARQALGRAYAPYSLYPVAAALLAADGTVTVGVNVENASYPLSLCAERSAVAAAVAAGHRSFQAVAVVSQRPPAPLPCGGCRQVLAEFSPSMVVVVAEPQGGVKVYALEELLPYAFGATGERPEGSGPTI